MTMRRASIRTLTVAAASALAGLLLALGAQPAQAQIPVASCVAPNEIPEDVFDAVDAEYPLDEFADPTCASAAKTSGKGCKKVVKIAAKCRNLVSKAISEAANLACAELADKAAKKACTGENSAEVKAEKAMVKEQAEEGSAGCADEVPPAILGECDEAEM
jgi:hypothetical protein